ncbi:DMT family transporter [Metallosphaera hakonensis]|uniref:Permease n=1 Tax=Metallosphaera hakonensis JCM 8857 = DSM 7519 TaxID=1293036 RepID=A0A2U9ISX5_9CREN|nr:DMT family transporter [Metallosphaera hakonensis]AWR99124.1 EamA family transporter [Metallosphaera hakonensis JCM 8857 = DSM 7519]
MSPRQILNLFALIVFWGSAFPIIKITLNFMSPFVIALIRVLVGGTILFLITRRLTIGVKESVSALLNIGIFLILLNLGIQYSSNPGLASTLIYTQPVFVLILSRLVLKERLNLIQVLGTVIAFVGIVSAVGVTDFNIGSVIALAGGLTWALGTIYYRVNLRDREVMSLNAYMSLFSSLFIFPVSLLDFHLTLNPMGIGLALLVSVTAQALGFILWFNAVRTIGPVRASSAVLLVPVSSYLFSLVLLGEIPTLPEALGSAITLLGVFLTFLPGASVKRA